jgi:hypothetical protein
VSYTLLPFVIVVLLGALAIRLVGTSPPPAPAPTSPERSGPFRRETFLEAFQLAGRAALKSLGATAHDAVVSVAPGDPSLDPWAEDATGEEPPPPRPFRVTVVDADGRPVAGAQVEVAVVDQLSVALRLDLLHRLRALGADVPLADLRIPSRLRRQPDLTPEQAQAATDATGRVRLDLPDTLLEFEAHGPGGRSTGRWTYPSRRVWVEGVPPLEPTPPEETVEVTLTLPRTTIVSGQVIGVNGEPLAGARVEVTGQTDRARGVTFDDPPPVIADDEGRYTLELPSPSFCSLQASSRGVETRRIFVIVPAGEPIEQDLVMPGAYTIRGIVVDTEGQPLDGLSVGPWSPFLRVLRSSWEPSDEGGEFLAVLDALRAYELSIFSDDWVPAECTVVELTEDRRHAEVVIVAIPAVAIEGELRWSDGKPVTEGAVKARPDLRDLPGAGVATRASLSGSATTAAFGRFRVEGLHPDLTYTLSARDEAAYVHAEAFGVPAGTQGIEVELPREHEGGVPVAGVVRDAITGAPLPAYGLRVHRRLGAVYYGSLWASLDVRDPDGQFGLPPQRSGELLLEVQADGYASTVFGPFEPDAEQVRELELEPAGGLTVEVVDEAGEPLPGALVLVNDPAERRAPWMPQVTLHGVADDEGLVTLPGVRPGSHWILGQLGERLGGPAAVEVPWGQVVTRRLELRSKPEPAKLRLDAWWTDGRPIAGREVLLTPLTDMMALPHDLQAAREPAGPEEVAEPQGPMLDERGGALLVGLTPGLYVVRLSLPGDWDPGRMAVLRPGESTMLEIRVDP